MDSAPQSAHAYGPSTPQIRKFLQRLAALNGDAEARVVMRFGSLRNDIDFHTAERALAHSVARSGRLAEQSAVAGPLLQLVTARADLGGALDSIDTRGLPSNDEPILRSIGEPALSAVLALMVRDVLVPAHFAKLYYAFEEEIPLAEVAPSPF